MKVSSRLAAISPSETLAITSKAKALKQQGVDVVSFAAGEPDFDTPQHIKEAAVRALKDGQTKYTPAKGMPALIEAVREKFREENGLEYAADQIVISCGAKHSLFNAIQAVCDDGDEVIIPSPYWVTYPEQVKLAGASPVFLPTREEDDFAVDPERLAAALTPRTRALIICSPSNPTGTAIPRDRLEAIARLACEKDFYLISDEIYEKLIFDDFDLVSIASFSTEVRDRTIVVNGVSKAYSMTGWRIGYLAAPSPVAKAIAAYQSHSTSNPATVSQFAALAALTGDQEPVAKMAAAFRERRDFMMKRLGEIKGVSCRKPAGTFYVFPNISALGMGSKELAGELIEKAKIAVVPGGAFGWDTHIRLSFADSLENLGKGLDRLRDYVEKANVQ